MGVNRFVIVGGLPGTGKSTLAAGLAAKTGWTVLRTDEIRRELSLEGDVYSDEMRDRVYAMLIDRARRHGGPVILDASWIHARHRQAAREIAPEVVELRCVLDAVEAERRMAERRDVSEADARVAAVLAARFDPWPEAVEISTEDHEKALEQALDAIRP